MKLREWLTNVFLCIVMVFVSGCDNPVSTTSGDQTPARQSDSSRYVGMQQCRSCHQDIYNTYIRTGMGRSIGLASKERSKADFTAASVSDQSSEMNYLAFWRGDSMYIKEYRVQEKDTIFSRAEQVHYIIGSGQHTNSHLHAENGYVTQMPMTYYTQRKKWDLPPGFENGNNTRFSRKIGVECMSCHNAIPAFVQGSENKFTAIPQGIDCERCHGPGSDHVKARTSSPAVDTSRYADNTIVNPGKLEVSLQFDICQRCHLQGNAVLKEGKSFTGFRPGKRLNDFISVFLPRYENGDEDFIMASHADRLKQSPCFIKSLPASPAADELRPYKHAMTCVTCHNPHVSVKETSRSVFNDACMKCHTANAERTAALRSSHTNFSGKDDCVKCHMPASGSVDIPHVSIHDHYIRRPVTKKFAQGLKKFRGLFSVNETSPDVYTLSKAYINQYEKFEPVVMYLDSADVLLRRAGTHQRFIPLKIRSAFLRGDHSRILGIVRNAGEEELMKHVLFESSEENTHAWSSYHISEAMSASGDLPGATRWMRKAVQLAPHNLEFRNKLGSLLAAGGKHTEAAEIFEKIIAADRSFASAFSNLGYLRMVSGFTAEAERLYKIGISLDPDNATLLLNLAGCYVYKKEFSAARRLLKQVLRRDPRNRKAAEALNALGTENGQAQK